MKEKRKVTLRETAAELFTKLYVVDTQILKLLKKIDKIFKHTKTFTKNKGS